MAKDKNIISKTINDLNAVNKTVESNKLVGAYGGADKLITAAIAVKKCCEKTQQGIDHEIKNDPYYQHMPKNNLSDAIQHTVKYSHNSYHSDNDGALPMGVGVSFNCELI